MNLNYSRYWANPTHRLQKTVVGLGGYHHSSLFLSVYQVRSALLGPWAWRCPINFTSIKADEAQNIYRSYRRAMPKRWIPSNTMKTGTEVQSEWNGDTFCRVVESRITLVAPIRMLLEMRVTAVCLEWNMSTTADFDMVYVASVGRYPGSIRVDRANKPTT